MNKTRCISARATPIERRALELIAHDERRKPSEMIRELVREAAQRRGLWAVARAQAQGAEDDGPDNRR